MEIRISAVIIAKDDEKKIGCCLDSLNWVDEIIVVDNGSIDKTVEIAKKYKTEILSAPKSGFSQLRNLGLKKARGQWVLYVDTDEWVPEGLKNEILEIIKNNKLKNKNSWFVIPRKNIILGHEMKYGGWWPDYVKRLFKRDRLRGWMGKLHEEPIVDGQPGYLKNSLVHEKHGDLSGMITKTNRWSNIEAELLFQAHHPPVVWWRLVRIMLSELWIRIVMKQAFLDGTVGILDAFYQSWSRFMTYAKLWEIQQHASSNL